MGFVTYNREKFGTMFQCIYLIDEQIVQAEDYLHKKYNFIPKDMKKSESEDIISQYHNLSEICSMECACLQTELDDNKTPGAYEIIPKILDAVAFIEKNRTELFVREVSMKVYGDSKYFEENTLAQVCQIFRKYKNKPCLKDELLDEILIEHMIKKEPQKFSMKGKVVLSVEGKVPS